MRPREQLQGEKLPGGWTVGEMIRNSGGTGGTFSVGYEVTHEDGRVCYLKAMDYDTPFRSQNTPELLIRYAKMYLFEKQISAACRDGSFRRVVHAIESGSITPPSSGVYGKVEYLIFELAEGDIRRHLDIRPSFDTAFMLRVLHNVAVGLQEMHTAKMAHQDMKPSNVLIFPKHSGAKIADLGRAWSQAFPAPHDDEIVPGESWYAPPELQYREVSTDHRCRRFASDLYHFGNLIAFVFAKAHVNALITNHLASEHRPRNWGGGFSEVLPYVKAAFGAALAELEPLLPEWPRADLMTMIRELCEPDPAKRGHPLNAQGNQDRYALQRYISRLDNLSRRSEHLQ